MSIDAAFMARLEAMIEAKVDAKVGAIERKIDILLARSADAGERFCQAALEHWGAHEFQAAELLDWADAVPELRRDLRDAARVLCREVHRPTARQLGCALKDLSRVPMLWYRIECRDERNTQAWRIVELRD